MKEYINRHYDESILKVLEGLRRDAVYSCSDPRLHIRERERVHKFTKEAAERHKEDFQSMEDLINEYIENHGCIPYCVILQILAMRYLGAGLLDTDYFDKDYYPSRSSKSFLCMFWNLGSWKRSRFANNPLPERLEKYVPHINFDFDSEPELIGDRPLDNNFFVNVVKNLRAHLFMSCEAVSIYEHKARIEEGGFEVCFSDYHDLMVAARIGKNGSVRQIAVHQTYPNDKTKIVSWAIFEIV